MAGHPKYSAQSWLKSPLRTPVGDLELAGLLHNAMNIPPGNMRVLSRYTMVLVLEGRGYYVDASGRKAEFSSGDVLFAFPGIAHAYGAFPGVEWVQAYVVFDGIQFQLWQKQGLLNPKRPVLHLGMADYWRQRLQEIVQVDLLREPSVPVRSMGRFLQLLAEMIATDSEHLHEGGRDQWLLKSMRLLGERGTNGWVSPQQVAPQTGLSYENFRKRFSALAGESPGRFQKRRRLEWACTAIYHGEHSLKQIADELGFCDVFHFSKAFKQQTKLAPSEYRRRVRGH